MRLPLGLVLLLGIVTVAKLPASTVLQCGIDPAALSATGCYTLANFSTFHYTEMLDWQAAYGTADTTTNPTTGYDPVSTGTPWAAAATASGLHVGATLFDPASTTGYSPITRLDNVGTDGLPTTFHNWVGTFSTGDHLLALEMGVLELQFDRGISGALFRISTSMSGAVYATVKAYDHLNPVAGDTPLMSYSISATDVSLGTQAGPGGYCLGLQYGSPCNNAPFISIESGSPNIRSLVISTNNPGALIDTLFLDVPAPEPGTFALTAMVGILAIVGRRRMLRDRRS